MIQMNPLMFRINIGMEDSRLLEIIDRLEAIKNGQDGSASIAPQELKLLQAAYNRLELITR